MERLRRRGQLHRDTAFPVADAARHYSSELGTPVEHVYNTLKTIMRWGVRMGALTRNPVDAVPPPGFFQREMEAAEHRERASRRSRRRTHAKPRSRARVETDRGRRVVGAFSLAGFSAGRCGFGPEMAMYRRPLVTCLDGIPDEFILTTADVAAITNDSAAKIADMLGTGKIPGMFRVGHRMKIYAGDLRKYFESQKVGLHRLEGWPRELIDLSRRRRRKRA